MELCINSLEKNIWNAKFSLGVNVCVCVYGFGIYFYLSSIKGLQRMSEFEFLHFI